MVAEPLHNSRALDLFDKILHNPHATMRIVELVGRGIAAEARCHTLFPQDDKRPHSDPPAEVYRRASELADRVEDLCAIEDDLAERWHRQEANRDDAVFEAALIDIVSRLERWPQHSSDLNSQ